MFSYSAFAFLCLGIFLLFSDVRAGVKSPYRKTDDLTSGEKGNDLSAEIREQQRITLDQIKENITHMSTNFLTLKEMLDHHVQHVHQALENRCQLFSGPGHNPADGSGSHIGGGGSHPSGGSHSTGPSGQGSQRPRRPGYPASFMRPPRVRNPNEYDFAICNMKPNSKAKSNVTGRVILQQKKNSPTLYLYVRVSGFDVNEHGDHEKSGPLTESQKPERLQDVSQAREDFSQQLSKMAKNQKVIENGHSHSFRVHERADISGGCGNTGTVYNPQNLKPGVRHLGDLGNIECDEEGVTSLVITDESASLRGQYSIVGKPLVIHQSSVDYGTAANDESDCLACCIIEKIPSNLYNEYQFPSSGISRDQIGSNCGYTQNGYVEDSYTHGHYVSGSSQSGHHHHHHGSGGYPGGQGSGRYPSGQSSGGYPGGQGSGGYPGGQGSGGYPGGQGSGGYPGGQGSGGYPGGQGSGGYPGGQGSGVYRPGYGSNPVGSGTYNRPSGSVRPGGHGSHLPVSQGGGGHDIDAGHIDNDEELSQRPTDYKRGKNPYPV